MMLRRTFIIVVMLLSVIAMHAQVQWLKQVERKGQLYGGWGWNRASYTTSDIHFTGDTYDFTLLDVKAKDRQTAFDPDIYFGLKTITIPQTNFRFGYFINDHIAISVGVDHMKYVMTQYQTVEFEGNIGDTTYNEFIDGNKIMLDESFLKFEHTDGLNYIHKELETYLGLMAIKHLQITGYAGAGLGALLPKSNVTLMKYPRNDEFHLAGFGLSAKAGLELMLWEHFFIRFDYKTGFINMPDIVTRAEDANDRASQHFFFAQRSGMFGFKIPIVKKKKSETPENDQ